MSYDTSKLTKLAALKALAERTKEQTDANARSVTELETKVSAKADKATTLSGYGITDAYTQDEVDAKISSVYTPAGSVAFASLPALSADVLGNVYNVTDSFTTTSDFVEGSGNEYPAGTNVVVVSNADAYAFDVLAGFVDLSGYAKSADVTESLAGKVDKVDGSRLMTSDEATKLAGIDTGANKYTHPAYTAAAAALVKIGRDATGHVVIGAAVTKDDITGLGIPSQDTTYEIATDDEVTEMLTDVFGE